MFLASISRNTGTLSIITNLDCTCLIMLMLCCWVATSFIKEWFRFFIEAFVSYKSYDASYLLFFLLFYPSLSPSTDRLRVSITLFIKLLEIRVVFDMWLISLKCSGFNCDLSTGGSSDTPGDPPWLESPSPIHSLSFLSIWFSLWVLITSFCKCI